MTQNALKTVDPLPLPRQDAGAIMEQVIAKGDLAQLKPDERARYYLETCRSLGINPLVKPFEYITLNNKLTLYATRTATDQLRSTRGISIEISSREALGDIYIVTAKANDPRGRSDESTGAVNIAGLKGDALANAYMKAETKAKRRVTLSICGLGWMDESETAAVPGARIVPVDTETGEILDAPMTRNEAPPRDEPSPQATEHPQPQQTASTIEIHDADASRMRRLHAVAKDRGLGHDELHAIVVGRGKASTKELTAQEMDTFTNWLEKVSPPALQVAIDAGREDAPKEE